MCAYDRQDWHKIIYIWVIVITWNKVLSYILMNKRMWYIALMEVCLVLSLSNIAFLHAFCLYSVMMGVCNLTIPKTKLKKPSITIIMIANDLIRGIRLSTFTYHTVFAYRKKNSIFSVSVNGKESFVSHKRDDISAQELMMCILLTYL